MIGTIIEGRYQIIRKLGEGAMGAVYEAVHTGTGGRVALKVIMGDLARNPEAISRFQREARAAGVIDTQYVTKVSDTGIDRTTGMPFLVMEFLTGQDLSGFLKQAGPIAPDVALRIVAQACIGLQKAHDAQIVHRDIKPANMFLAKREEGEIVVKLLDFGVAKMKMDQMQEMATAGLTKTGTPVGSPLYMSPEQALGRKDIDPRSDLWSLGITLYQALSGRTPFGHITAFGELIVEIASGRLTPVQEFAPWVPPQVAAIVDGALRVNPNDRFQSASGMLAAIRPLLPNGFSIHESMLVPLQPSTQANVQPRLPMRSAPSLHDIGAHGPMPDNFASQSSTGGSRTADALVRSQAALPPHPSSGKALFALGSAVAVATAIAVIGIGGAYLLLRRPPHPAPPDLQANVSLSATASSSPPPPSSTPSSTTVAAASAASEPAPSRVPLVIVPGDASVEVDGKLVETKNGIVDIVGAPGSTHRVRVFKYKYETIKDVIVTDTGAKPAMVQLSFGSTRSTGDGSTRSGPPGAKTDFK